MRRAFISAAALTVAAAWPMDGPAQQVVDVLPLGARVRAVVLESSGRALPGQIASADGCLYISAEWGRDGTIGVPLSRLIAIEVDASDIDVTGDPDEPARQWLPVDLDAVLQRRPLRCEGQPFTKITPLRWGVLIRS